MTARRRRERSSGTSGAQQTAGRQRSRRRFHSGFPNAVIHRASSAGAASAVVIRYQIVSRDLLASARLASALSRQLVCCPPSFLARLLSERVVPGGGGVSI